jgi:hypothetical protein
MISPCWLSGEFPDARGQTLFVMTAKWFLMCLILGITDYPDAIRDSRFSGNPSSAIFS